MDVVLVGIGPGAGRARTGPEAQLVEEYRRRSAQYASCAVQSYRTSEEMLVAAERTRRRHVVRLVLLDPGGEALGSEAFAERLRQYRNGAVRELWAVTGPADGWCGDTLAKADLRLSLGPMTLPHRLAQVVIAEQIYRALTILAGHPYHAGH